MKNDKETYATEDRFLEQISSSLLDVLHSAFKHEMSTIEKDIAIFSMQKYIKKKSHYGKS